MISTNRATTGRLRSVSRFARATRSRATESNAGRRFDHLYGNQEAGMGIAGEKLIEEAGRPAQARRPRAPKSFCSARVPAERLGRTAISTWSRSSRTLPGEVRSTEGCERSCEGSELRSTSSSTVVTRRRSDVACQAACFTGHSGRAGSSAEPDSPSLAAGRIPVAFARLSALTSAARSVYETEGHWFESSRAHPRKPGLRRGVRLSELSVGPRKDPWGTHWGTVRLRTMVQKPWNCLSRSALSPRNGADHRRGEWVFVEAGQRGADHGWPSHSA